MASLKSTPALTPAQQQAIALLASGSTMASTARQLAVHRSTLYNWFSLPTFQAAYQDAAEEARGRLYDELTELSRLALDTIRQLLTDPKTPPSVRLRASLAVLQHQAPQREGRWMLPEPQQPAQHPPHDPPPHPPQQPPRPTALHRRPKTPSTPPPSIDVSLDGFAEQLLAQFAPFHPRK